MTLSVCEAFYNAPDGDSPVRGFMHRPSSAANGGVVLTHGAGANCESPLLRELAEAFCEAGLMVLRCDLPFRQSRPHGPPTRGSGERDQQGLRSALRAMRDHVSKGSVFLAGHSYGGRQASMLTAADASVADALLLLSYPLHPPKQPGQLRTAHLPSLRVPAFFVHGVRDAFGSTTELESAIALVPARTELLSVEGAGHELLTRSNRDGLIRNVVSRFLSFARMGS